MLFYTITSLITLSNKVYGKLKGFGYEFTEWSELIFEEFILDWIIVMLFMTIIAITTKYMIFKKVKWKYIVGIHLFFSFFIGFIIFFLSSIVYLITGKITFAEIDLESHIAGIISVADLNFLIYFSMISIVYLFYYFEKWRSIELEKSQLANQLTNARMNILKYKLHPHFLFNTLNSISSLIETNSKLAQNTVADFGDLLRDLLSLNDAVQIPLHEELSISKRYLDIMALRFSDDLKIQIEIDSQLKNVLVPSLILLSILENSIKHGYSYDHPTLIIKLSVKQIGNKIGLKIENNGAPLKKGKIKYGNGVQNTIDRLKLIYKDSYSFEMKNSKEGNGIYTLIQIPLQAIKN